MGVGISYSDSNVNSNLMDFPFFFYVHLVTINTGLPGIVQINAIIIFLKIP